MFWIVQKNYSCNSLHEHPIYMKVCSALSKDGTRLEEPCVFETEKRSKHGKKEVKSPGFKDLEELGLSLFSRLWICKEMLCCRTWSDSYSRLKAPHILPHGLPFCVTIGILWLCCSKQHVLWESSKTSLQYSCSAVPGCSSKRKFVNLTVLTTVLYVTKVVPGVRSLYWGTANWIICRIWKSPFERIGLWRVFHELNPNVNPNPQD